jgi:ADP-ribose pyrophosphatase YjhB (NUDIX family)
MPEPRSSMIEICVFRFTLSVPEYLILRRADDETLYPGLWQYVTGTLEGEERAVDGALRELREETMFEPVAFWRAPYVHSFYDEKRETIQSIPLFAAQVPSGQQPQLSAEHSAFRWLPYREASDLLVWPGQRQGLKIVQEYLVTGSEAAKYSRIF